MVTLRHQHLGIAVTDVSSSSDESGLGWCFVCKHHAIRFLTSEGATKCGGWRQEILDEDANSIVLHKDSIYT